MKSLLRIYLILTQLIYLFTLPTWMRAALLAFIILGSASTFDVVLWILFLPVIAYPFLIVGCSVYGWKNHIQKPIQAIIMNFVAMLWIIAYGILWWLIS